MGGEILVFKKMLNFLSSFVLLYVSGHSKQKIFFLILNFLSFLVLLYVSGHFQQKKIFQTDRKILTSIHVVYFGPENFTSVFQK